MNHVSTAELAEMRREALTADATQPRRTRRWSAEPRAPRPRPLTALQNWLAAGQL